MICFRSGSGCLCSEITKIGSDFPFLFQSVISSKKNSWPQNFKVALPLKSLKTKEEKVLSKQADFGQIGLIFTWTWAFGDTSKQWHLETDWGLHHTFAGQRMLNGPLLSGSFRAIHSFSLLSYTKGDFHSPGSCHGRPSFLSAHQRTNFRYVTLWFRHTFWMKRVWPLTSSKLFCREYDTSVLCFQMWVLHFARKTPAAYCTRMQVAQIEPTKDLQKTVNQKDFLPCCLWYIRDLQSPAWSIVWGKGTSWQGKWHLQWWNNDEGFVPVLWSLQHSGWPWSQWCAFTHIRRDRRFWRCQGDIWLCIRTVSSIETVAKFRQFSSPSTGVHNWSDFTWCFSVVQCIFSTWHQLDCPANFSHWKTFVWGVQVKSWGNSKSSERRSQGKGKSESRSRSKTCWRTSCPASETGPKEGSTCLFSGGRTKTKTASQTEDCAWS